MTNYDQREDAYAAQKAEIMIIKRGEVPANKIFRGFCMNCKTEVEFPRRAAKYNSDQRDGDFLSVDCPVCNNLITARV